MLIKSSCYKYQTLFYAFKKTLKRLEVHECFFFFYCFISAERYWILLLTKSSEMEISSVRNLLVSFSSRLFSGSTFFPSRSPSSDRHRKEKDCYDDRYHSSQTCDSCCTTRLRDGYWHSFRPFWNHYLDLEWKMVDHHDYSESHLQFLRCKIKK